MTIASEAREGQGQYGRAWLFKEDNSQFHGRDRVHIAPSLLKPFVVLNGRLVINRLQTNIHTICIEYSVIHVVGYGWLHTPQAILPELACIHFLLILLHWCCNGKYQSIILMLELFIMHCQTGLGSLPLASLAGPPSRARPWLIHLSSYSKIFYTQGPRL